MKFLLLKFVVCFAAALAAPADKQKRDILPGDPRYGTDHLHQHHHEHENEVQFSKSAGGYVGSYTVPDDTVPEDHSFQVQPQSSYGLPSHTPGTPLGSDLFVSDDAIKNPLNIHVPSTSYGIPDTTQTTAQEQPKFDIVHVQKTVVPEVHHEIHNVQQPAVVQKQGKTVPHSITLPQAKVTTETQGVVHHSVPSTVNSFPTSYASYPSYSNIPVKTLDHHVQVQVPQPYHVPVTKHVPYPVPVPHTVEVPKPYYVRVPQPVQVTVDRPYPVEIPRPVPYPIHHYVKTNVPVAHEHHVTVDAIKANPLQTFFDNTQSTFQNVASGFPSFPNLESFQNSFENFEFPPFTSLPFPSIPFLPQQTETIPATPEHVPSSTSDSITVDSSSLNTDCHKTVLTKPTTVVPVRPTKPEIGPGNACAGCTVPAASSKKEYVQPTDANGGYVY